ncbi:MAG: hypothetical protein JXB07_19250 [Anaerolineae bacterium]|nr:hypothetical protein [Anaerolineae bacterium]
MWGHGCVDALTSDFGDFYSVNASTSIEGNIILDSNLRFFGGLSVGLVIFWMALFFVGWIQKAKSLPAWRL